MTRRTRRFVVAFLILLLLAAAAFVFRKPILIGLASAWIVDDQTGRADAVVVLGGGLDTRPFAAARAVTDRLTTNVLVMSPRLSPAERLGVVKNQTDLQCDILAKEGVANYCVHRIGTNVSSTFEESLALRDWSREHKPKTILVPTDVFHTRRVAWLMHKQLKGSGASVKVVALDSIDYNRTNWWQHEEGLIAFQNEVVKYFLYRWKY